MHIAAKKWDTSCHHCKFRKARFAWSDTKTLKIDHLSVAAGESWAFVGKATAAANPPSRGPLAGDLTLLSGQRESHFSRVTRLSFEQLQKLVSDEWQRQ